MIVETKIQRNYGTDHEYIVQPPGLAKLWTEITGRKTVTDADLAQIESIGGLFFLYDETVQGDDVSKAIVIERAERKEPKCYHCGTLHSISLWDDGVCDCIHQKRGEVN